MRRTIKVFLALLLVGTMFIGACGALAADGFTDVPENAWYCESAYYCAAHNIMAGTAEDKFSPKSDLTRAMLVTVLYRLNGAKQVFGDCAFTDVEQDSYYYDAVKWEMQMVLPLAQRPQPLRRTNPSHANRSRALWHDMPNLSMRRF